MKFWDIIRLAVRNLRESKLRAGLTTVGVVVGVTVIVSMVSFGLGLQRNAVQRFRDLDLFNEITVSGRSVESLVSAAMTRRAEGGAPRPGERRAEAESARAERGSPRGPGTSGRVLDDAAIAEIASLEGVAAVEPSVNFQAYVRANERVQTRSVGGASVPALSTRFKNFAAGRMIASADAREAVVDDSFLRAFGYEKPEDAVGKTLEVLTDDRAVTKGEGKEEGEDRDDEPLSFFGLPLEAEGGGEDRANVSGRAFQIVGVLKSEIEGGSRDSRRFRGFMPVAGIYVPLAEARELSQAQKGGVARVALELARASGVLKEGETEGYPLAIVRVTDPDVLTDVQKRLAERNFSAFSIVDQLKEIRTVFLILNSALGLLGGISLFVASFGIANTMIMSILERTREIGIMMAIGAEDRIIKTIFFAEAALIGLAGGVVGTLSAWAISAAADRLAYRFILQPREIAYVSFFALPPWLWAGAILFAVLVAIVAALYPAARAARIDPVKALRHD
jgi:ABC-type antimicrobial peptide transport system permease subunit